jgi:hypothetical protein
MGLSLSCGIVRDRLSSYHGVHDFRAIVAAAALVAIVDKRDRIRAGLGKETTSPEDTDEPREPPTFDRDIDLITSMLSIDLEGEDVTHEWAIQVLREEIQSGRDIGDLTPIAYDSFDMEWLQQGFGRGFDRYDPIAVGLIKLVDHSDCDGQHTPGDALDILIMLEAVRPICEDAGPIGAELLFLREKIELYQTLCIRAIATRQPIVFC